MQNLAIQATVYSVAKKTKDNVVVLRVSVEILQLFLLQYFIGDFCTRRSCQGYI